MKAPLSTFLGLRPPQIHFVHYKIRLWLHQGKGWDGRDIGEYKTGIIYRNDGKVGKKIMDTGENTRQMKK